MMLLKDRSLQSPLRTLNYAVKEKWERPAAKRGLEGRAGES